jgi:phosphoserine phosphatase RsbU/P
MRATASEKRLQILVAEDDAVYRRLLEGTLRGWGYDVLTVRDGLAAWQVLQGDDFPPLALLDWMMPGLDGPEVCRRVRTLHWSEPPYLILLTARDATEDVVAGLNSGANDYITKPFNREELQARLRVGRMVGELQRNLALRVRELEEALVQVKQLRGLLPICMYCKKIRDDRNYWEQVEAYLIRHADVRFSHGICPECWETEVRPQLEQHESGPWADSP